MKFESKSSLQMTVKYYSKRGIGWHGFVVIFYLLGNNREPYKNIIYLDQTLGDESSQETPTVAGAYVSQISVLNWS